MSDWYTAGGVSKEPAPTLVLDSRSIFRIESHALIIYHKQNNTLTTRTRVVKETPNAMAHTKPCRPNYFLVVQNGINHMYIHTCVCVCEYEQQLRSSHTLIDSARKSRQSKDALKHTLRFWGRNFGSNRISEYLGIWCVYICLSGVMDNGLPHICLGIPDRIYKYRYGFACQVECRSVYNFEWCGYRDSGRLKYGKP